MKISALVFICFYIVFAFSCAKNETPQIPETKSQAENSQNLQSKFDKPILEVTSDFIGMMWMTGKITDFRLFEDGTVEYDAYPKTGTKLKAEEAKTAERTKINEEQIEEFIDFLSSKEFLDARNKYTQKDCFAHDSARNIEIKFKYKDLHKQISVINNCEVIPEPVSILLEKIGKVTKQ